MPGRFISCLRDVLFSRRSEPCSRKFRAARGDRFAGDRLVKSFADEVLRDFDAVCICVWMVVNRTGIEKLTVFADNKHIWGGLGSIQVSDLSVSIYKEVCWFSVPLLEIS